MRTNIVFYMVTLVCGFLLGYWLVEPAQIYIIKQPEKCRHGKQWEEFMNPKKYPVIIPLEDGTIITHEQIIK